MALKLSNYVELTRHSAAVAIFTGASIRNSWNGATTSTSVLVIRATADFFHRRKKQPRRTKKTRSLGGRPSHLRERRSPPMRTSEEETVESWINLEMAIADLERVFRKEASGGDHLPPLVEGSSSGRRPPVRVAYQGPRGSYCQEAAAKAFPSSLAYEAAFPCSDGMEDAFNALENFSADRAVVPAENSLDGPIDRNIDLLLRHPSVCIIGELVLPVNHCLLSSPEARVSGLRRIVSHPQALAHCRQNLDLLQLEVDEVSCAADAARFVAENRIVDTAVIGSKIAAREFGLRVLEENFQDQHHVGNFNRFLEIGLVSGLPTSVRVAQPQCHQLRQKKKTTVAFSLERGASGLFQAMWEFESRGVKVTRVDHRPNRSKPLRVVAGDADGEGERTLAAYFNYVFVMDVEGITSDSDVLDALAHLEEIAQFVRVLGSYNCSCDSI